MGLNRISFVVKAEQRANLALWKHKVSLMRNDSNHEYFSSRLLNLFLRYNTRLIARRNTAWNIFKRPLINRPSAVIIADKMARMSISALRIGFAPLLELKSSGQARALVSLMKIVNRKEATKTAKAI